MRDALSSQPILDGELLRAFAAFADTLSFTHAATRIGLSQPALFDRVRRLSLQVGAPLYRRTGRTLALTPTGVIVAAFARDLIAQTHRFVQRLDGQPEHRLTLAAGQGAYLYLLGPAVAVAGRTPGLQLSLRTLGGPATVSAVEAGEAHLGVGVYDLLPRSIEARPLVTTPLCAAIAADHPLAPHAHATLEQLARHRLILAPSGQRHREIVGRAVASVGATLEEPIEADGWPLMLSFAATGLGVAVVNGICTPPPGVILRPIPELGTLTYRLIQRRDAPPSAALAALAGQIVSGVQRTG